MNRQERPDVSAAEAKAGIPQGIPELRSRLDTSLSPERGLSI
jgi:hypothetical protein